MLVDNCYGCQFDVIDDLGSAIETGVQSVFFLGRSPIKSGIRRDYAIQTVFQDAP
jgi:hypothetical protein